MRLFLQLVLLFDMKESGDKKDQKIIKNQKRKKSLKDNRVLKKKKI